ncbi:MAG: L,D-transpeptidase family protein [Clostridia bacterium]|nr:L,D-transpeptidase family protein [Clostridia bacterium]
MNSDCQIITVSVKDNSAQLSLYGALRNGIRKKLICSEAFIGINGIGKEKEGDGKTPVGVFRFCAAFGNKPNPGTLFAYIHTDDSYFWVDDSSSAYYNELVSVENVKKDWSSAEHILSYGAVYNYVLAIDYNKEHIPGIGSGIFLHCSSGRPTAGCVAVPEDIMIEILKITEPDCMIVIDTAERIDKYLL